MDEQRHADAHAQQEIGARHCQPGLRDLAGRHREQMAASHNRRTSAAAGAEQRVPAAEGADDDDAVRRVLGVQLRVRGAAAE
eukprot:14720143-Alexandrium_andersonii.AAC.1